MPEKIRLELDRLRASQAREPVPAQAGRAIGIGTAH